MKRSFEDCPRRLFCAILDHPWRVILALAALTLLAGSQLPKMRVLTDFRSHVPMDKVFKDHQRIRATFDIKDILLVGITREQGVLDPGTLKYARDLADDLGRIHGVHKVRSLFSEDNIRDTPDGLDISPFLKGLDAASVKALKEEIRDFPATQDFLVSKDRTCTAILVELEDNADKNRICAEAKRLIKERPPGDSERIYLSGLPVFETVLGHYILRDLLVMIPIASGVIVLFLFLAYRSFLFAAICLAKVTMVVVWTVGLMAFLGYPLQVIHSVMPAVLIAISIADEIHIFGVYLEKRQKDPACVRENVLATMQQMWRPVLLTSVTDAFAFLSFLTFSSIPPLKSFGAFTAFGAMAAMVLALTATPAALVLAGPRLRPGRSYFPESTYLENVGGFLFRNRTWIRAAVVLLFAISLLGVSKIYTQESWTSNIRKDSEAYVANEVLKQKLAGTAMLYIELDTGNADGIKRPDFLKAAGQLQDRLKGFDWIGGSLSPVQPIERMNQKFTGRGGIPDSPELIGQYLMLLDGSSYGTFWDHSYRRIRIAVFCRMDDYVNGCALLSFIRSYVRRHLPHVTATYGGEIMVCNHWVSMLPRDTALNFASSLCAVFLVLWLFYRSFQKAIVVAAPVVLAVAMNLGILGFCGVPLGIATSMFSSIILGVGVNYGIHFQSEFDWLRSRKNGRDPILGTFGLAGRAILWDAAIVISGFLVLVFSRMPPNQTVGLMVSLGMATALVSSFLVVPALISTKKDKDP